MGKPPSDPIDTRKEAIRVTSEVLDGTLASMAGVRREWPSSSHADALVKRAYFEVQHFFVVRTRRQRRILELVRQFLLEGGTPAQFETAYEKIVRECLDEPVGPD
jgi:hypothetical protein